MKAQHISNNTDKNPFPLTGLSTDEVKLARIEHGSNHQPKKAVNPNWLILQEIVTEPMFLLLVTAAGVYFVLQESSEGFFMIGAILVISAISWYQSSRAQKALDALNVYTQVCVKVIRNNELVEILRESVVVDDLVVISEGDLVPVDGQIVIANDFTVNESILTGEAYAVDKHAGEETDENRLYHGTLALSGQAVVRATAVGEQTRIHQIGRAIDDLGQEKSLLQQQIDQFVKRMAFIGITIFLLILGVEYFRTHHFLDSLLEGLTIAMSVLPEEIPVAFTVFLALGAYRLARRDIIIKRANTTELLGSIDVLCLDKTGTITENRMELKQLYVYADRELLDPMHAHSTAARELIATAMWASETAPFDPMEQALHTAYAQSAGTDLRTAYYMVDEYPLSGRPPMMTHIFGNDAGHRIIATKGAPEAILAHSRLSEAEKQEVEKIVATLSEQGIRVLGVGFVADPPAVLPEKQQDLDFTFLGLVAFFDPPKPAIKASFGRLYQAGIRLKMITGDSVPTALAIARQSGFRFSHPPLSGQDIKTMDEEQFKQAVVERELFCRISPEQKLEIIQALKDKGLKVGMTGDGVNDGLALKAAHIGIAMGKRGTEIARRAASLILVDGNIDSIAEAVAAGRRIYANLKKAIQYIISIHIPIILAVAVPTLLGWRYSAIFSPIHVIFLELIMGPTCSIVYENEPMEADTMDRPPRPLGQTFFGSRELLTSIMQGLAITAGVLGVYFYALQADLSETQTRSMVFLALLTANIFLTLVNRSFYHSIFTTLGYHNRLMVVALLVTIFLTVFIYSFPPIAAFFGVALLAPGLMALAIGAGVISTLWYEGVKAWGRYI
ncbi:MAG: cation-translocating P-type ATPase [Saprospiraceae bacterium]|nr:cation-translocating P-type ATPase [Lewinella sp.]